MAKCPNCGRTTARTEDWACQWCGYPLLSGSYKKIPKTYKQLQEERLGEETAPAASEPALEPEPEAKLEAVPVVEPSPRPVQPHISGPVAGPGPEAPTELEARPAVELPAPAVPLLTPEPVAGPEPEPSPELEAEAESEPAIELPPRAVTEPVSRTEPEPKPEPTPAAPPPVVREPEIEITVDELIAAYEAGGAAADARFDKKALKVTGVVERIEVKEMLDIYYINLASGQRNILQSVRCFFDKSHGEALSQLSMGQTVTVQGTYDGTIMDIRMKDCVLV